MRHTLILASVLLVPLAGCPQEGERAQNGCPDGETCSPDTPNGLAFEGADFGDMINLDQGPKVTAVGGTQRIKLLDGGTLAELQISFDAKSAGPAFTIDNVLTPYVSVRGAAEGDAYLRIVEPGTDLLYDRVSLDVDAVARATLVPTDMAFLLDPAMSDDPPAEWALLEGVAPIAVVVRLFDAENERLVDESLDLTADADAAVTRTLWDSYELLPDPVPSVAFDLAHGDGTITPFDLQVVGGIDAISFVATDSSPADPNAPILINTSTTYCFHGLVGDVRVAGVEFAFTADAGLDLTPFGEGCVIANAQAAGSYVLTVGADGLFQPYTIEVRAMAAARAPAAERPDVPPALGERAILSR